MRRASADASYFQSRPYASSGDKNSEFWEIGGEICDRPGKFGTDRHFRRFPNLSSGKSGTVVSPQFPPSGHDGDITQHWIALDRDFVVELHAAPRTTKLPEGDGIIDELRRIADQEIRVRYRVILANATRLEVCVGGT